MRVRLFRCTVAVLTTPWWTVDRRICVRLMVNGTSSPVAVSVCPDINRAETGSAASVRAAEFYRKQFLMDM